jgi:RNA polymerase sigma-70 factor (ECF subfamily)
MSDTSSTYLHDLIRRMSAGEATARDEVIRRAYERLRRLTQRMLQDFPRVRRWEDTDDVLQQALVRLLRALKTVPPTSAREFFRLAATQVRRELLDLARHYYGPEGRGANHASDVIQQGTEGTPVPAHEGLTSIYEPSRLHAWSEFHEKVENLPEEEHEIFGLLWYQGLTQSEAAALLDVSESTVKRRWLTARTHLGEFLRREQARP